MQIKNSFHENYKEAVEKYSGDGDERSRAIDAIQTAVSSPSSFNIWHKGGGGGPHVHCGMWSVPVSRLCPVCPSGPLMKEEQFCSPMRDAPCIYCGGCRDVFCCGKGVFQDRSATVCLTQALSEKLFAFCHVPNQKFFSLASQNLFGQSVG